MAHSIKKKPHTLNSANMMGINARTGLRAGEGCSDKEVFIVLLIEPDPLEKLSPVSFDNSSSQPSVG